MVDSSAINHINKKIAVRKHLNGKKLSKGQQEVIDYLNQQETAYEPAQTQTNEQTYNEPELEASDFTHDIDEALSSKAGDMTQYEDTSNEINTNNELQTGDRDVADNATGEPEPSTEVFTDNQEQSGVDVLGQTPEDTAPATGDMGESAATSDTSVQSDDVLEGAPDASMEEQAQQGEHQSEKKLFDIPENLPTVTVDRITGTLEDVKAKVRSYLAPFKKAGNNIYFNKSAGFNIRFSGNGIKHTLIRSASPDLANSLMATPELLERSVYLGKDKNRKKTRGVKFYHNFAGKVSIDGDVKTVLITAREVSDGKIFYDQAIIKQSSDVSASGGKLLEAGSHLPARGAELSKKSITENQAKSKEDEQIQADLKEKLPKEVADKVVIDREGKSAGKHSKDAQRAEGWYIKGDKVYINPDNIQPLYNDKGKQILSKSERIAFVAWHELGHRGVHANRFWTEFKDNLQKASSNPFVSQLAKSIQSSYAKDGVMLNELGAVEEALVEINAAVNSGKVEALQAKWGVSAPFNQQGIVPFYQRLAEILRQFVRHIAGKSKILSNTQLFELLDMIKRGASASIETSPKADGVQAVGFDADKTTHDKPTPTRQTVGASDTNNTKPRTELTQDDDIQSSLPPTNAELESQIADTVKRYGGQKAYKKAKAKGKTKLNYKQWVQVRTPEFKSWFGDWESDPQNASKVTDPDTGEPLVVYHGSPNKFTEFNSKKTGSTSDSGLRGKGFYLSNNKLTSEGYGNNLFDTFVSLKNPFNPSEFNSSEEIANFLTERLEEKGYEDYSVSDGIFTVDDKGFRVGAAFSGGFSSILKDAGYDGVMYLRGQEVVALNPNQIKSATENTGAFSSDSDDIRFSLNEDNDSEFAKAVDAVAKGDKVKARHIKVGTTPKVFKLLGVADMNVTITPKVINKIIKSKHSVNPAYLKKIPAQINNPVAISKSRTVENGYIVFTELTENVAGKGKPVIAAMHIKTSDNGIEVMNIASAYGRNKGQMESDLGKAVYWNTKKGSQLANAFGLQLPPELRSLENLSKANIRTEKDLKQDNDVKFSLAYHGSPHQFDRFDYSHMGSGEGNQAFGWGGYFTDKEEIARGYAKMGGDNNPLIIKFNGEVVGKNGKLAYDEWLDDSAKQFAHEYIVSTNGDKQKAIDFILDKIKKTKHKTDIPIYEESIGIIKNAEIEVLGGRNLYKVKIHGDKTIDELNFMRWDKPFSKQPKKIRDLLNNISADSELKSHVRWFRDNDQDGRYFYQQFSDDPKETSLQLLKAGIDGIQYPTDSHRRGSHEDSFNYVVFDENAVEIDKAIQFSLPPITPEQQAEIDRVKELDESERQRAARISDSQYLLDVLARDVSPKVRADVTHNSNASAQTLESLVNDENESVRTGIAKNPATPISILRKLDTSGKYVSRALASRKDITGDILDKIYPSNEQDVNNAIHHNPNLPVDFIEKHGLLNNFTEEQMEVLAKREDSSKKLLKNIVLRGTRLSKAYASANPNAPINELLEMEHSDDYVLRGLIKNKNITKKQLLAIAEKDKTLSYSVAVRIFTDEGITDNLIKVLNTDPNEARDFASEKIPNRDYPSLYQHIEKVGNTKLKLEFKDYIYQIAGSKFIDEILLSDGKYDLHKAASIDYLSPEDIQKIYKEGVQRNEKGKLHIKNNLFRDIAGNKNTPPAILTELAADDFYYTRANVAENLNTPIEILSTLAKDEDSAVRLAAAKNKNTPPEAISHLIQDEWDTVREAALKNPNLSEEMAINRLKELQKDPDNNIEEISELINSGKIPIASIKDASIKGVMRWRRELRPVREVIQTGEIKLTQIASKSGLGKEKLNTLLNRAFGEEQVKQWRAKNQIDLEVFNQGMDSPEYQMLAMAKRESDIQTIAGHDHAISFFRDDLSDKFDKLYTTQVASGHPAGFGFVLVRLFDGDKSAVITEVQSDVMSMLFDKDKEDSAEGMLGDELADARAHLAPVRKTWPKALMRNAMRQLYDKGVEKIYAITPGSMRNDLGASPPISVVESWTGKRAAKEEGFGNPVKLNIDGKTVTAWDAIKKDSQEAQDILFSRKVDNSSFAQTEQHTGGKQAYDRAKAKGKTKLNYKQWIQVRTPEFKSWFGDWELASSKVKRTASNILQARTHAAEFKGKVLENIASGIQATVSRNALDKMLSKSALGKSVSHQAHLSAVSNLDSLFEKALVGWDKPDRDNDRHIKAVTRFFVPMSLKDKVYLVKLTVKQIDNKGQGNRIYTVESLDVTEKSPVPEMVDADLGQKSDRPHRAIDSLVEQIQKYKPDDVSKVIDPDTGEPMVMYHGTNADFDTFMSGFDNNGISHGEGFYLTADVANANSYTGGDIELERLFRERDKFNHNDFNTKEYTDIEKRITKRLHYVRENGENGGNVMPLFVNLRNPKIMDAQGRSFRNLNDGNGNTGKMANPLYNKNDKNTAVFITDPRGKVPDEDINAAFSAAQDANNDGLIVYHVVDARTIKESRAQAAKGGSTTVAAFKANQIKSAIGNNGAFSPTDDSILKSQKPDKPKPTAQATTEKPTNKSVSSHLQQVKSWHDKVSQPFNIKAEVIASKEDLPQEARSRLDPTDVIDGLYYEGKAYLIADQLSSYEDVVRVYLHEAIGHGAVIDLLQKQQEQGGKALLDMLDTMYQSVGRVGIERNIKRYGFDFNDVRQRREAVLEYIAHLAETGSKPNVVQKFIAALRDFIRQFFNVTWTDTDTLALIERAKQSNRVRFNQATVNSKLTVGHDVALGSKADVEPKLNPINLELKGWTGSLSELSALARDFYTKELQGQEVFNASLNNRVVFSSEGKGEAFGARGKMRNPVRAEIVQALKELVGSSVRVMQEKPQKGREGDTKAFHTLVAPLQVNDDLLSVKITVREALRAHKQGATHKFYDVRTIEIKRSLNGNGVHDDTPLRPSAVKASTVSVAELAKAFNIDALKTPNHILKSLKRRIDEDTTLNDEQKEFLNGIGGVSVKEGVAQRLQEATQRWQVKIRQGMVDRFASLMEMDKKRLKGDITSEENISKSTWVRARMSNVASGAVTAMMNAGRIYLDKEGVIDIHKNSQGLIYSLSKLGSAKEVERFFAWIVANRAEKLSKENREMLFSNKNIAAGKTLNQGKLDDGRARTLVYNDVFKEFQQHRKDILNIAEQAGVISAENKSMWEEDFYVPFYRVIEDNKQAFSLNKGGLTRQEAFRQLKGRNFGLSGKAVITYRCRCCFGFIF